jgi:hypothetical protein
VTVTAPATPAKATPKATAVKLPKILEAINLIQAEVGKIEKNGVMDFKSTKYSFVKNDDIIETVTKQLQENNVVTRVRTVSRDVENRDLGSTRVFPMVSVEIMVTYVSAIDGSEFEAGPFWGEGAGNDDKGLRKAYTTAQKIANLLTFNIATGEPDPDEYYTKDANLPASAVATPAPSRTEKTITGAAQTHEAQIKRLQGQVKAAAGAIGYDGSQINAIGEGFGGAEFIMSVDALQQTYDALVQIAKERQEQQAV